MCSFRPVRLTYTLTVVAGSYLTVINVDVVAGPGRLVFLRFREGRKWHIDEKLPLSVPLGPLIPR